MKINDTVAFQAGLDRHYEFGKLVDVDMATGTCSILTTKGKKVVRDLKRVKPAETVIKENARRIKRNYERRLRDNR